MQLKLLFLLFTIGFVFADSNVQRHTGFVSERIVGGTDALPHSAPWMITMQYGVVVTRHICGGSIINTEWVLTAGHCVLAIGPEGIFYIVAGRNSLSSHETSEQIRYVNRSLMFVHEDYNGGVAPHDIALMKVEPFNFNDFVQPIALPAAGLEHTGNVVLHGWGSTSNTGTPNMPDTLQTVTKPIISLEACAAAFLRNLNDTTPLHENNICTGPLTGGISACSGDSGGPISQNGEVLGIASWTIIPCGHEDSPTVYCKVSAYIDWIENVIENNPDPVPQQE